MQQLYWLIYLESVGRAYLNENEIQIVINN
jgi:hypothetical protein